ncbi:MAG TPA: OsmC family protein [Longimicrobium sp.]|nr:OsmC family protein [Longimicrobium sp.]
MAVEISGRYVGNKKMELRHGPSGAEIRTAAPVDNNGDGSSFSPTDLLAASLGACMVTVMAIFAEKNGIPFEDAGFVLEKHMIADPRRVDAIPVRIRMPRGLAADQRTRLERVALTCPVHRSLLPEIRKDVQFVYED